MRVSNRAGHECINILLLLVQRSPRISWTRVHRLVRPHTEPHAPPQNLLQKPRANARQRGRSKRRRVVPHSLLTQAFHRRTRPRDDGMGTHRLCVRSLPRVHLHHALDEPNQLWARSPQINATEVFLTKPVPVVTPAPAETESELARYELIPLTDQALRYLSLFQASSSQNCPCALARPAKRVQVRT